MMNIQLNCYDAVIEISKSLKDIRDSRVVVANKVHDKSHKVHDNQ